MPRRPPASDPRPLPLAALFPLFFVAVYLSHLTLLRLPYFWDEGGYYVPAALDFMRTGTLIPHSTITNAHPPLPAILLAALWRLAGFVPSVTRTFICMVSASALLAVYSLGRRWLGELGGAALTLLTACYPVWYAQSTLAHADIFAAAFTLWALNGYFALFPQILENATANAESSTTSRVAIAPAITTSLLFAFSSLSKETAIVTPAARGALHLVRLLRFRRRTDLIWTLALAASALPLVAWYAYHFHRTGFVFGNPEFLRYNATANLDLHRTFVSLYHRALHLLGHMNLWVATTLAAASLLLPRRRHERSIPAAPASTILLVLLANWVAFSVLGGALLTRYLLPMYPLVLLFCVACWRERIQNWPWLAAMVAAAFVVAIHVNPPYAFAPEDNLTYRDMIVLHQQAVAWIAKNAPEATVLTAWPASAELSRPDLGYTTKPVKVLSIDNFSAENLQKAAQDPGAFDTALLFSTKYEPPPGKSDLSAGQHNTDARYFDFHHDLLPAAAARMLHGEVVWQGSRNGEWAAILRFPRVFNATAHSIFGSRLVAAGLK